ncbi:MAG: cation:proton antiporter [Candidatus Enteromonas sp.]
MYLKTLIDIPTDPHPEAFKILLPLGLILLTAKLFALLFHKIKVPQVIGFLCAGLVVGLIYLIPGQTILTDYTVTNGIGFFAKIAVILILFSAGVETDLKKIKEVGKASIFIALGGVFAPMLLTFVAAHIINMCTGNALALPGVDPIFTELYYGVVLTATSVSITVATLKELGKLDGKIGSALVSSAIIDDVIGIIVLSLVISLSSSDNADYSGSDIPSLIMNALPHEAQSAGLNLALIIIFMLFFFGLTIGLGIFIRKFFNWMGEKYPHHIRNTIFSLAFCFLWAYVAEYFNIADITGAYLMGLILSSTKEHNYIDHRAETTNNYLFAPVFFGNIALGMYQSNFNFADPAFWTFFGFGCLWIVLGLVGKVLGCSGVALCFKFKGKDALKIGVGMMARAEVLIVCAQKGVDAGLISNDIVPFCLILILLSSFLTPILLKALYKEPKQECTLA